MCQKVKKGAERDKAEGFTFRLRPRLRLRQEDGRGKRLEVRGWRQIGRLGSRSRLSPGVEVQMPKFKIYME